MEAESFQRIRSITVDEGFLGGLSIDFTDHLNCLIGSRGAGKTTLLEFLRYALAIPASNTKRQDSLIKKNLKAGTIRVVVETAKGRTYAVERKRDASPQVLNDAGEVLPVAPEDVLETTAYVYSQAEIEEMAETPTDRLALIDRFAEDALRQNRKELGKVTRDLEQSTSRLLGLADEASDSDELAVDLARAEEVRRSLNAHQDEGGGYEFEEATALKALRLAETQAIAQLESSLASNKEVAESLSGSFMEGLSTLIGNEIKTGPNSKVFAGLNESLESHRTKALASLADLITHVEAAEKDRQKAHKTLLQKHRKQETAYDKLLKSHEEARAAAEEILEADQKIALLKSQLQDRRSKRKGFQRERSARKELIERLSELRDQRSQIRKAVIEDLNARLSEAGIEILLNEHEDTGHFESALQAAFRGTKLRNQGVTASAIAQRLTPFEFAELVSNQDTKGLARQTKLTPDAAQKVVDQLAEDRTLYELEVLDPPDVPTILFKDGTETKRTDELSTGQKFTAILPILLLQSTKPLICDEPESHLDQETLVQKVVTPIEKLVGRRQLIFATHNANIVVLGDSGDTQVVVLRSDGKASGVLERGTVDETREAIGSLLEGGPDAFKDRARRYGKRYKLGKHDA